MGQTKASLEAKYVPEKLTETIRLRIPEVASQAETGENGTHLIRLRTPRIFL